MKLIEIKNNLAKIEYHPADFPLVLSDFLTIDDGNQIVIAQVVSIESSKDDETNCAVIKFSLDLNSDNSFCAYSGYVPTLDALISKTKTSILESIFSNSESGIFMGQLTSDSALKLHINPTVLDKFLYIQSDRNDDTSLLFEKFMNLNDSLNKKTLYVDFDGVFNHPNAEKLVLGKNFKLPVDNHVLSYIYEHDLTGLTLEQKTIVQDIILEIQDYVDSLDSGYIPFDKLLDVVNDIYQSDKSTGIILLRNKLLKYHQLNIFASKDFEVLALNNSLESNNLTVLSLAKVDSKWQKEVLDFIILNVDNIDCYLFFNVKEDAFEKRFLADIFKSENLYPIISSSYESSFAPILKSYARNLVLFKPQEQQKAFATYNSFFNKLAEKEFIISGESTFYTPLIIREIPNEIRKISTKSSFSVENQELESPISEQELFDNSVSEDDIGILEESVDSVEDIDNISFVEEELITEESLVVDYEQEPENDLLVDNTIQLVDENVDESSLEQEIADDVDKMFFAEAALVDDNFSVELVDDKQAEILEETNEVVPESINYNEMFTDEDLDFIDDNAGDNTDSFVDVSDLPNPESLDIDTNSIVDDDELPGLDSSFDVVNITTQEENSLYDTSVVDNFPTVEEPIDDLVQDVESLPIMTGSSGLLGSSSNSVPVFKTELEDVVENKSSTKIAEGNIVYHPKYGRGVVEQMVNYGNKSFCSILFDNLGRRLLDPNLADLKQM